METLAIKVGVEIPWEHYDLEDGFSTKRATKHGLCKPWVCAIDFLPGATLAHSQIYPCSVKKLCSYGKTHQAPRQGYIQPSLSAAWAGPWSSWEIKHGRRHWLLRTVKFHQPMPLVYDAQEQLRVKPWQNCESLKTLFASGKRWITSQMEWYSEMPHWDRPVWIAHYQGGCQSGPLYGVSWNTSRGSNVLLLDKLDLLWNLFHPF